MELEILNKLYLELSQIATAKTKREMQLEDLLSSSFSIAARKGENTNWERFTDRLSKEGISPITSRVFKVLPSDEDTIYGRF